MEYVSHTYQRLEVSAPTMVKARGHTTDTYRSQGKKEEGLQRTTAGQIRQIPTPDRYRIKGVP